LRPPPFLTTAGPGRDWGRTVWGRVSVGLPTPRRAKSAVGNPTPGRSKGLGFHTFRLDRPLQCSLP
jgi:hypothetical protein